MSVYNNVLCFSKILCRKMKFELGGYSPPGWLFQNPRHNSIQTSSTIEKCAHTKNIVNRSCQVRRPSHRTIAFVMDHMASHFTQCVEDRLLNPGVD